MLNAVAGCAVHQMLLDSADALGTLGLSKLGIFGLARGYQDQTPFMPFLPPRKQLLG